MRSTRFGVVTLAAAAASGLLILPAAAASETVIVTYAGDGTAGYSGDHGQATSAKLNQPSGVWLDNAANVFVGDTANHRVRKVTFDGVITTVAGSGVAGFAGDGGPAASAQLNGPTGVVTNSSGVVYIADTLNNRVRKVSGGVITTVAGTGTSGYAGDGQPAAAARLSGPTGLAVDSTGNLYVADTGNDVVRKVQPNGTIVTFAGKGKGNGKRLGLGLGVEVEVDIGNLVGVNVGNGKSGPKGNTGPATKAKLDAPMGVVTRGSDVLIADTGNDQVRKVSGGTITVFAGTGSPGFAGDGAQASSARLRRPTGVAYDPLGNVSIVDAGNARLRQVSTSGVISTIAGNGVQGDSGENGPCDQAQIRPQGGVTADAANVFFADTLNHKVKRCHKEKGPPPALPEAPGLQSLALAGSALAILGGGVVVARSRRRSLAATSTS